MAILKTSSQFSVHDIRRIGIDKDVDKKLSKVLIYRGIKKQTKKKHAELCNMSPPKWQ